MFRRPRLLIRLNATKCIRIFMETLDRFLSQVPDRASSDEIATLKSEISKAGDGGQGSVPAELALATASASGNAALETWVKILVRCLPRRSTRFKPLEPETARAYAALQESIDVFDTGRSRRALLQILQSCELSGGGPA